MVGSRSSCGDAARALAEAVESRPTASGRSATGRSSMSTPVTRAKIANTSAVRAAEHARGEPAGREEHLQRPAFEEAEQAAWARRGSRARCARAACRARSRRSRARGAARTAWRSRSAPASRRPPWRARGRSGLARISSRARSSGARRATISSNVPLVSSIIAHSSPSHLDALRGEQRRRRSGVRLARELLQPERARPGARPGRS